VLNIAITTRVVITTDPTANGPVNSLFPVGNAISVTLEEIAGVNRSSVNMCTTPTCDSNGVSADTFTVTIPSNFGPCGEGYAIKLHTVPAGPNESAPMLFGLGTFTLSC